MTSKDARFTLYGVSCATVAYTKSSRLKEKSEELFFFLPRSSGLLRTPL
jgi:hypothetical protein